MSGDGATDASEEEPEPVVKTNRRAERLKALQERRSRVGRSMRLNQKRLIGMIKGIDRRAILLVDASDNACINIIGSFKFVCLIHWMTSTALSTSCGLDRTSPK